MNDYKQQLWTRAKFKYTSTKGQWEDLTLSSQLLRMEYERFVRYVRDGEGIFTTSAREGTDG